MDIKTIVLFLINDSLDTAASWFARIMAATKMSGIYLSFVAMYLIARFLLSPVFGRIGPGASDKARKKENSNG